MPVGGRPDDPLLSGESPGGGGVDAVALPGRPRPVVEDVAQVAPTAPADHLGAGRPVTLVDMEVHRLQVRRLGEARPAASGVELGIRTEQLGPAAGAVVGAGVVVLPVASREGSLGPLLPQDGVLLGGEPGAPLGLGQVHGTGALGHCQFLGSWARPITLPGEARTTRGTATPAGSP